MLTLTFWFVQTTLMITLAFQSVRYLKEKDWASFFEKLLIFSSVFVVTFQVFSNEN